MFEILSKIEKNQEMFDKHSPENNDKIRKKNWFQQVEHMQVPNGTGPGVQRSKRPLFGRNVISKYRHFLWSGPNCDLEEIKWDVCHEFY